VFNKDALLYSTVCTIGLAWRCFTDTPIAVGANRDEQFDRLSEPPTRYATDPLVIAPRDVEAGGTWIGYNEHGVFAAITNRWTDTELAAERSRGTLVASALEYATATAAATALEEIVADFEFAGFSLLVADATDAIYLSWNGTFERTAMEPGVHVIVNVGYNDRFVIPSHRQAAGRQQAAHARRLRTALQRAQRASESVNQWLDVLKGALGYHEYGVCVHGDGFGTRSSSVLAIGSASATDYWFADGPPCQTAYKSVALEGQF